MFITVEHLSMTIEGRAILDDISFEIDEGDRWAVIGRNGAGKSTLIRSMARLLRTTGGRVSVHGRDIWQTRPRDLAKAMAYVPQAHGRVVPYRVRDYVLMGRFAYQGFYALASQEDHRITAESLDLTDTAHLGGRTMDTLSGGELQRVLIAGAVSQRARVLLLDEPATHLDPRHCQSIQRALRRIHAETGTTIVTITHDVNSALTDYTHVLALVDGRVAYCGEARALRSRAAEMLEPIYGLPFEEALTAVGGRSFVVPREVG